MKQMCCFMCVFYLFSGSKGLTGLKVTATDQSEIRIRDLS